MLTWLVETFAEHWGSFASLLDAGLTVCYSRSAKTASENARLASEQTRQKMQSVDLFSEVNRLNGRVDDLLFRLE